jgi:tetratricopeptide (TPR) repeat protein
MAERFIYIPSIGIFLITVCGISIGISEKNGISVDWLREFRIRIILFFSIILCLAVLTFLRIPVWKNNVTLWEETVRVLPNSAVANHNYGQALYRIKEYRTALPYYKRALELDPDTIQHYFDVGTTQAVLGDFKNAVINLEKAYRRSPSDVNILTNLATVYSNTGKHKEAIRLLRRVLEIHPDFYTARENLKLLGESP